MKRTPILIIGLFAPILFASPILAQEKCGREIINYNPPQGSYKQISPDEAQNMTNYTASDQKEVNITLERIPDQTADKHKNRVYVIPYGGERQE